MKAFEKVCIDVIRHPKFAKNVAIGVLLSLVPVVNFFSFWYLIKFGNHTEKETNVGLPDWVLTGKGSLVKNFFAGVRIFCEFLLIVGGPIAICAAIFAPIDRLQLGMCLGLFVSAPAFAMSTIGHDLKSIPRTNILSQALKIFTGAYGAILPRWESFLIPSVLFLCFQILAFLAIPVAFMWTPMFFGFLFLIAYAKQSA
jgi:hypothetical protein